MLVVMYMFSDKMKAYITITPPDGGANITVEKLRKLWKVMVYNME